MNINRVVLIGNLTRDPEVKYLPNETPVCTFGIALNSREKKGEEWQDRADFFDVEVFGAQAESCGQYLARGSLAGVEGRLRQDRWEKDGQKRSRVLIRASVVQFLTRREGDEQPGPDYTAQTDVPAAASSGFGADDDIPF